jgi:hypothetical protein
MNIRRAVSSLSHVVGADWVAVLHRAAD